MEPEVGLGNFGDKVGGTKRSGGRTIDEDRIDRTGDRRLGRTGKKLVRICATRPRKGN